MSEAKIEWVKLFIKQLRLENCFIADEIENETTFLS